MIHIGSNNIINEWSSDIFVAYSAANPVANKPDVWRVARIPTGQVADSVDVDYIRAADVGTSLVWHDYVPIIRDVTVTAPAPVWMKIRQFSKVTIATDGTNTKIGVMRHSSNLGYPALALTEALKYQNKPQEAARGTAAVSAAIQEWEDIIAAKQLQNIAHKKGLFG